MAGSGLHLCIRLLIEAMDLLRAMMEYAPSLLITPAASVADRKPNQDQRGPIRPVQPSINLLANLVRILINLSSPA